MSCSFFQNRECAFFPCHNEIPKEEFNCLFCYCPLYTLGERCGGDYTYLENGTKSCLACTFPHRKENYSAVLQHFPELAELAKKSHSK
ncbi:MAG: cysteine-rich small domain-containing protein [Oscillospiraceae bacterium]|nr:cysteine-rich small domain-containing protein [Oscillospiraceae bacterium]